MKTLLKISFTSALCVAAMVLTSFVQPVNKIEMKKDAPDLAVNQGFAIVELFTSQGCSSCPPAEELVARVQQQITGKPVYILAFHVDYWNHQGWADVFSSKDFTKRQYQYARWLKLETVYTPQIVVNGSREFIGSQEASLNTAITAGLKSVPRANLSLAANQDQNKIIVKYQAKGAGHNIDLQLALVQKIAQTAIKRGENAGRLLSHVQIVRQIQSQPVDASGAGIAEIILPKGFDTKGWEVIGFLQNKNSGEILAAAKPDFNENI